MKFKILTVPHTSFAAGILVDQLIKLGHQASIVQGYDVRDDDIYLIYNASGLTRLPKKYIVMQTEISSSHWFNSNYLKTLTNALAVWDYSELNTGRYKRLNKKIAIVTPGIRKIETPEKDIETLFYGHIKGSQRRERILKQLIGVQIIENTLGQPMWDILKRTKKVINIHYYDNSPPELYRIHESISHGCQVWMHDESELYTNAYDNLEEIKTGLKVAGI